MERKGKDFKQDHKDEWWKMKEEQKKECQECGSTNVVYDKDKDETICQECGAVFAELTPKEEKKFEKAHEQG